MAELSAEYYVDTIRENAALFARAASKDLVAPIPTCPAWSMADLVAHLGEVHRFWTLQIANRAQESQDLDDSAFASCPGLNEWLDARAVGHPDPASIPAGLIDWFNEGAQRLVAAFEEIDPETAVWHWSGDNRAITHMRNQAVEQTMHRFDAESGIASVSPIDPVMARDGIEQYFDVQVPAARKWGKPAAGGGETYHFHQTDGDGEWFIRFDGDSADITREHARADVAIQGSAGDLFLWLWGRSTASRLTLHGKSELLDRYRELVPASE